jgi:hypothetical protein
MNDKTVGDNIVEEARQVRQALIDRYGGIDGYVKHLQALDRAYAARARSRRREKRARPGRSVNTGR